MISTPKSPGGRWDYNAAHSAGYLFIGGELVAVAHEDGRWQIYPTQGTSGKERSYYAAQRAVRAALREMVTTSTYSPKDSASECAKGLVTAVATARHAALFGEEL